MIRTADAVGADGVVLAGHSVDAYNPKTVRASVGSLFHLPLAVAPDAEARGRRRPRRGTDRPGCRRRRRGRPVRRRRPAARPGRLAVRQRGLGPPGRARRPRRPPGRGSRSPGVPRASTSPPPPRSASTRPRARAAEARLGRWRAHADCHRRIEPFEGTAAAAGRRLPDGVVVRRRRRRWSTLVIGAGGADAGHATPATPSGQPLGDVLTAARQRRAGTGAGGQPALRRPADPHRRPRAVLAARRSGAEVLTTARISRSATSGGAVNRVAVGAPQRPRPRPARPRALRPRRHRRPRAPLAAHRRQGLRAGDAQPVGQAQRRAEEADAHHGPRRLRPAEPADRRAARRRPHRHRTALAPPAPLRRRTSWSVGSSTRSSPGPPATIEFDADDDLPRIAADPDKFTQVVTNLVENAVRHGSGEVRSACTGSTRTPSTTASGWSSRTRATASRRRCGAGCSPSSGPAGARGGSGLGIYLVNGLTRAHGGTVTIGDGEGGGARICVDWPAAADQPQA